MYVRIYKYMYVRVCVFVRGGEGEDLCEGSLYLCVCVRVCEGGNYQINSGLDHQRETKTHLES